MHWPKYHDCIGGQWFPSSSNSFHTCLRKPLPPPPPHRQTAGTADTYLLDLTQTLHVRGVLLVPPNSGGWGVNADALSNLTQYSYVHYTWTTVLQSVLVCISHIAILTIALSAFPNSKCYHDTGDVLLILSSGSS